VVEIMITAGLKDSLEAIQAGIKSQFKIDDHECCRLLVRALEDDLILDEIMLSIENYIADREYIRNH
jgi:hypothetical protein